MIKQKSEDYVSKEIDLGHLSDEERKSLIEICNDTAKAGIALLLESSEFRMALAHSEGLLFLHGCEMEGLESGKPTPEEWVNSVNKLTRAIKELKDFIGAIDEKE
jgi:hypothetical protein